MPMLHRKNRNPGQEETPETTVDKQKENPQKESAHLDAAQTENSSAGSTAEEEQKPEKYSFLQETIKPEPLSRERLFRQTARIALYGVILGIFACIGFFALKPWAERTFKGEPETVTIPEDEEPSEEEQKAEEEKTRETEQKLDSLSYEEMLASMYSLADEAKRSVATVSRVSGGTDWTDETTGIEDSAAGIVTADNGQELLIFAPDSVCSDAESWIVTFADGSRYGASLKMRDRNRCLAVFSVRRREISTSTWSSVKVAVLGNSNLTQQGDPVIALGNTFSYADGISYGIISSTDYKETFYDGECDILATDISAASGGSGVLFNMQGEVVGLIMASIWEDEGTNTANAYAISDLKSVIELMANGQNVPYIGVYATTVTSRLKEDQGMPAGIYVIDVDPDSPAMAAGIQSGDIICEINGETVTNLVTFEKAVLETRTDQQIQIKGKRLGADGYVDVDYTVTVGQK